MRSPSRLLLAGLVGEALTLDIFAFTETILALRSIRPCDKSASHLKYKCIV
jgi:hypothetical protein